MTAEALAMGARPGEELAAVKGDAGLAKPLQVPPRLLMGPGPSNSHPRVLVAQGLPTLGHLHPPFLAILDEIKAGLRYMFQTESPYTCLISGTGHAGMEAAVANLCEPGETILIINTGIWGVRAAELSRRYGANVEELSADPGKSVKPGDIVAALQQHKPAVLFVCQGESSSGVQQSLAGVGEACSKAGTLLLVDSVCTLGGAPLFCDAWGVDCTYSGSQKCLSAPAGASPFMLSERAYEKIKNRKSKVSSWYFDAIPLGKYWGWEGEARFYHHTGPSSVCYGMREALSIACGEGLEALWARHQQMYRLLWGGLVSLGLQPFVEEEADRLATVNTIKVPEGIDWLKLNAYVMDKYRLEIAGGLGPSAGKCWRIGIMGYNATPANVAVVIAAFKDGLQSQGYDFAAAPDTPASRNINVVG
jgi:alanine-glyoxylate transaminase/serine-glyoxylate transaminase/serine-pyruvate transaminase